MCAGLRHSPLPPPPQHNWGPDMLEGSACTRKTCTDSKYWMGADTVAVLGVSCCTP